MVTMVLMVNSIVVCLGFFLVNSGLKGINPSLVYQIFIEHFEWGGG